MDPTTDTRSSLADHSMDAIRLAVNIAQSECICQHRLSVCLLTDAGERAGVQPFLYESSMA